MFISSRANNLKNASENAQLTNYQSSSEYVDGVVEHHNAISIEMEQKKAQFLADAAEAAAAPKMVLTPEKEMHYNIGHGKKDVAQKITNIKQDGPSLGPIAGAIYSIVMLAYIFSPFVVGFYYHSWVTGLDVLLVSSLPMMAYLGYVTLIANRPEPPKHNSRGMPCSMWD